MEGTIESESSKLKSWTTGQVVLATLFVVGTILAFWLLYRFRIVVFLFFIAMVIGTTMRPIVGWLYKRGISRSLGIILIYLIFAALLVGFMALIVPLIVDQATQFSKNLPEYQLEIRKFLMGSNNLILRNLGYRIPSSFSFFGTGEPTSEELIDQVSQTFRYAGLVINGFLSILAVFLLAYYWTQEGNFLIRNLLRLIPNSHRNEIREFINVVEVKIGQYVQGQGTLSLIVGCAAFIAYSLIGLPYALILGIIAGLMELVPIFGPALGAIPAVLVALSVQPGAFIWVLVATGLIQLAENIFLVPRIMKNSMGVNPILTLLSLVTFSSVFGFPGALLAIPLAAIIQLAFERFYLSAQKSQDDLYTNQINIQKLHDRSEKISNSIQDALFDDQSFVDDLSNETLGEMSSVAEALKDLLKKLKNEEGI